MSQKRQLVVTMSADPKAKPPPEARLEIDPQIREIDPQIREIDLEIEQGTPG